VKPMLGSAQGRPEGRKEPTNERWPRRKRRGCGDAVLRRNRRFIWQLQLPTGRRDFSLDRFAVQLATFSTLFLQGR